jgi:hypothetical protein
MEAPMSNLDLFNTEKNPHNDWEEHYVDMPEYNNHEQSPPFIVVRFKFRTQEDFDSFNKLIKTHLYNGEKVFDGMQRKNDKSAWYPPTAKASKYRYK